MSDSEEGHTEKARDRRVRGERTRDPYSKFSGDTNSKDPVLVRSRVFVGNLATDKVRQGDLRDIFQKYGTVLGKYVRI